MQAVSAGADIDLGGDAFMNLTHAVQFGKISEAVIDTAVCRVLRMKVVMVQKLLRQENCPG